MSSVGMEAKRVGCLGVDHHTEGLDMIHCLATGRNGGLRIDGSKRDMGYHPAFYRKKETLLAPSSAVRLVFPRFTLLYVHVDHDQLCAVHPRSRPSRDAKDGHLYAKDSRLAFEGKIVRVFVLYLNVG